MRLQEGRQCVKYPAHDSGWRLSKGLGGDHGKVGVPVDDDQLFTPSGHRAMPPSWGPHDLDDEDLQTTSLQ